jgi:hypothetical protein
MRLLGLMRLYVVEAESFNFQKIKWATPGNRKSKEYFSGILEP